MALYDIVTSQQGIHPDLESIVKKRQIAPYQRPISDIQRLSFQQAKAWIKSGPIILDAGCGLGRSTELLAKKFPNHQVIGIDKSIHRLKQTPEPGKNFTYIRSNLIDFWQLASQENWQIDYHYILYPNPWPKKNQVRRRWQGHPIFPCLLRLGNTTIVRSNWLLYLEEFAAGARLLGYNVIGLKEMMRSEPLTHFEQKYWTHHVTTYELIIQQPK